MAGIYVLAPKVDPAPVPTPIPAVPDRTLSNCYAYVKSIYPNLPGTNHILSHLTDSGEVAVFYYPDSGLYHYTVVESISSTTMTISETNYGGHFVNRRTVNLKDKNLIGFYTL